MSGEALAPYAARAVAPAATWRIPPLVMKLYTITAAEADAPGGTLSAEAERVAAAALPQAVRAEGGAHGSGFAVLHEGAAGTWLLLHWWAHGDILCQRLFRADPGTAAFADVSARPLVACVWELAVISHEREVWVRHMMSGAPDRDAYLGDRLAAGRY